MVFRRTRLDIIVTSVMFIAFIWAFFFGSKFGDLHYCTNPDKATLSYINNFVLIAGIILIYEMFQLIVLPGRTRLREYDKRIVLLKMKILVRKKIDEGIEEYRHWRK